MIDVQCDEHTLRVHPRSKAARFAVTGAVTQAITGDGCTRLETPMGPADVVIPRASITKATFTRPSMFGNGRIVAATADGSFRLQFRRGHRVAFETLALELGATV